MIILNATVIAPLQDFGSSRVFKVHKNKEEFSIHINSHSDGKALKKAQELKLADVITVELYPLQWSLVGRQGVVYFLVDVNP